MGERADPAPTTRGRDADLREAILRIGSSLDLDIVLREVVESARALTGARWGVIATVDAAGAPLGLVFSGFAPEEERELAVWPGSAGLFEHFRDLRGPLRVADLSGYVRALGIEPSPLFSRSFQGTPMRHGGTDVGSFFLAEKADGEEFTSEDEDVLALFAQQAAAAVANARAHLEQRRARADLEALVETCPVGVVVLDVDGTTLSVNREARRVVAGLGTPDDPADGLVCHRGDGREVTLADLADAETVRAEEVEISGRGGKSVRALMDATPIRDAGGAIERVVVALRDLAPFEALEHSRAEFLGMVSHELRAPLAAIKGSAATALADPREPDRTELLQYLRIVEEQADRMSGLIGDLLDVGRLGAGMLPVEPAAEDLAGLVERARTAFAGAGRHAIVVELPADLPLVLADGKRVVQVLENLLANAARHSPDTSAVVVAARLLGHEVEVSVADSGEGVPQERLAHLFRRHDGAQDGARSGLGLVICKGLVEAHGGRIRAESPGPGRGTRIAFTLPAAVEGVRAVSAAASPSPSATEKTRVLVVDDDPHGLRHARSALEAAGYAAVTTGDPGDLQRLVDTDRPSLVLLDLVLPGTDGIELMRTLPALAELPVIFLSAYTGGDTVARALEAGAADYIVKPFSPAELVARVALALRRRTAPAPLVVGDLVIDRAARRVTVGGRPVRLTATEYRLLHALSLDAGGATTLEDLMRRAWGPGRGNPQAVRSAVRKLRRKLGDDARNPKYILGERGMGYRMPAPDVP